MASFTASNAEMAGVGGVELALAGPVSGHYQAPVAGGAGGRSSPQPQPHCGRRVSISAALESDRAPSFHMASPDFPAAGGQLLVDPHPVWQLAGRFFQPVLPGYPAVCVRIWPGLGIDHRLVAGGPFARPSGDVAVSGAEMGSLLSGDGSSVAAYWLDSGFCADALQLGQGPLVPPWDVVRSDLGRQRGSDWAAGPHHGGHSSHPDDTCGLVAQEAKAEAHPGQVGLLGKGPPCGGPLSPGW